MQILLIYKSIPVLVDHVERLLKLLDLGLVEHGEHIGGGPLWPLLGGLSLGSLAGHDAACLSLLKEQHDSILRQSTGLTL